MKPKIDFNKSQIRWAAVVGLVIFSLLVGAAIGHFWAPQPAMAQHVSGVWADINADGKPDLLYSCEVVINTGPLVLTPTPQAQP